MPSSASNTTKFLNSSGFKASLTSASAIEKCSTLSGFVPDASAQVIEAASRSTPNAPEFTTNHIAQRAGMSVGTLYRYFPDKSSVVRHVVRREVKNAHVRELEIIRTSKATNAESLLCEVAELTSRQFQDRALVVHQVREMAKGDYEIVAALRAGRREVVQELHKRIVALEPARFGDLSILRLAAIMEAFVAAKRTIEAHESTKFIDAKMRMKLMKSFAVALT